MEKQAVYFSKDNKETCIGKVILGMEEFTPFERSRQIEERLGVFKEARANHNLYQYVPRTGVSPTYAAFSPADQFIRAGCACHQRENRDGGDRSARRYVLNGRDVQVLLYTRHELRLVSRSPV